ncbi:MAG: peptidoglycan-binding protein [Acidobacteria bacterium]|nr:peptidoglycan-binding protein [Acidobacteriota bacterium]
MLVLGLAATLCCAQPAESPSKSSTAAKPAARKPAAKSSAPKTRSTRSTSSKHTPTSKTGKKSSSHKSKSRKTAKNWRSRGQQNIDPQRAREIQAALIREHYLEGEPSGTWDPASQKAMEKFQADNGWQSKSIPDSRALIKLGLGPSRDHLLNPESAMGAPVSTPVAPVSTPAGETLVPADPPQNQPQ